MPKRDALDSDNESTISNVQVDLEFADFNDQDFHGLKSLFKQLFSNDHQEINLSSLSNQVVEHPFLGCTVKIDDSTDPYAAIGVVPFDSNTEAVLSVKSHLLSKCANDADLTALLNIGKLGFLFNERLINMPPQIYPQMLRMLIDELKVQETQGNQLYTFTHFVVISKIYNEVDSLLDQEEAEEPVLKKQHIQTPLNTTPIYFQPEDEILGRFSLKSIDYVFKTSNETDSRRTFQECGIDPFRRIMVIPANCLDAILKQVDLMFKQ